MVFLLSSVCSFFLKGLWQVICLILTFSFVHEYGLLLDIIFLELFVLFGGCWNLFFAWVFPFSSPFYWAWSVFVEYIFFPLFVGLSLRPYLLGFFRSLMGLHFCLSLIRDFLNFMVQFVFVNPFNVEFLIFRDRKY